MLALLAPPVTLLPARLKLDLQLPALQLSVLQVPESQWSAVQFLLLQQVPGLLALPLPATVLPASLRLDLPLPALRLSVLQVPELQWSAVQLLR